MWLIIALAATFSVAAAIWVGSIARRSVLEQHVRRLSLETDQLGIELSQALAARVDAVRSAGALALAADRVSGVRAVFELLAAEYPHLDWIAAADSHGIIAAANEGLRAGEDASALPWVAAGLRGLSLGGVGPTSRPASTSSGEFTELGNIAVPVHNESNRTVGVIAAHVRWRRAGQHPERLTDEPDPRATTEIYVLDAAGMVLLGPQGMLGRRWPGVVVQGGDVTPAGAAEQRPEAPQFERLPDGRRVLVARSALSANDEIAALGWRVQLSEPNERVFQRANALTWHILWVSLCLGAVTSALGLAGARHVTRRLKRLAYSVAQVGQGSSRIEMPEGADEIARLGQAFGTLLEELARERGELERRVAVRTQEVERLADEARYAAIVRERLQLARDLHDTLAHSMMAILSEIRFLRRLQAHDSKALPSELARAERIAHEGLREARNAIAQMRTTAVRESGLGPALANVFERFLNATGVAGDFEADDAASRFGDERAETIVRMAQEALRNIERHARATRVTLRLHCSDTTLELQIEDDGVGFDLREVPAGHFGMVGLREQAALIGARLDIRSTPGRGTTLQWVLDVTPFDRQ